MNKYKFYIIGALACSLLHFNACTKNFEEINTPQNLPAKLPLGSLFLEMQNVAFPAQNNNYQMSENLVGDVYGRYFAISNTWLNNYATFNAPDGWLNAPYKDAFGMFYPSYNRLKEESNSEGIFYQWAQILKVSLFHRITDMYGPIPYTTVGGTGEYESQDIVYKTMIQDLSTAIKEITAYNTAFPADRSMQTFDQVYQGDFSKWVKYANSLKLRLAMRMVYADPAAAKQAAEEAVDDVAGLIDVNDESAAISYLPNPIKIMWEDYSDTRVAADIVTYMKGYNDPRLPRYFQTTSQIYSGSGYYGLRVGITIPSKDWAIRYSTPAILETDRLMWMNAAEVAFLRAEGALRGWNMKGTAASWYNRGLQLSFEQHGLASSFAAYSTNTTARPAAYQDPTYPVVTPVSTITIAWSESDVFKTKLERLITQKWIAMYPIGQEAWSEQRRTGFPRLLPNVINRNPNESALTTQNASRIPYAPDEKLLNLDKYNRAVGALNGPDNYSTRLWWDKNSDK